jgi:tetratricopeptide (TPR) repeat protein
MSRFWSPYRPAFLAAAILGLLLGPAAGDSIILKNGRKQNGLIRIETPQWIQIETEGVLLRIDREQIERVEKQPTAENLMLQGMMVLRRPEFEPAADLLAKSLQAGADADRMRRSIIELSGRFQDRLVTMNSREKGRWTALLDELSRRGPDDGEWAYWRGEWALAVNEPLKAMEVWRALRTEYYSTHPKERTRITRWAVRQIGEAMKGQKFEQSVAALELLNASDPDRAKSCEVILKIREAADARDRGDVAEACRIYARGLMPLSPEIAKMYLKTTLEPHCARLCELGKFEEAIALMRDCAQTNLSDFAPKVLAGIYEKYVTASVARGQFDLARGRLAEGSRYFEDADIKRLTYLCDYGEQRSRIAADDYVGHYQLAMEMRDQKLNDAAVEEFYVAAQSPDLKDLATAQIDMIRKNEALEMLKRMRVLYKEEKYLEMLTRIEDFRKKFPGSEYKAEVDALAKQAHQKAAQALQTQAELAQASFEHARRLYLLNQIDEALEILQTIKREHGDTAAAQNALRLEQEIYKRRVLEGAAPTRSVTVRRDDARSSGAETLMSTIDPALLDQMDEDALKQEIQEILKQLQM